MSAPTSGGLPCPCCGQRQTKVIDSRTRTYDTDRRKKDLRVRRRHRCMRELCGHRFSTDERYSDIESDQISDSDRLIELAEELRGLTSRIRSHSAT